MNHKSITVYDIAKEAGVSPATVSRVLTSNAKVSEEKKKRVQDIIDKYDFEPNWLARSLSKQETNTIGMLVPDIRNPFYSTLFVECELVAAKYGYNMILCNSINELSMEGVHLKNLLEKRVEAIIQVGGSVDEVNPDPEYIKLVNKISKKIPFIIAGELEGVEANVYRITPTINHGMEELLNYLLENGHKNIALLGGRDTVIPTKRKRIAMEQILSNHGINVNKDYIIDGEYSIEGGYKVVEELLKQKELPTAIIAINDMAATGMIKALNMNGIRIPEDMSIVGYDDTFFSEISSPKLTSMSYNLLQYAETIMETIRRIIQSKEVERMQYIPTSLQIRASVNNILN